MERNKKLFFLGCLFRRPACCQIDWKRLNGAGWRRKKRQPSRTLGAAAWKRRRPSEPRTGMNWPPKKRAWNRCAFTASSLQWNAELMNVLEQDVEQLTTALQAFQQQREQLVQTVQQKHQESVTYHSEAQRLAKICEDLQVRNPNGNL